MRFNLVRGVIKYAFIKYYKKKYSFFLYRFIVKNKITHALIHYGITAVNMKDALNKSKCNYTVHFHGFDAFYHQTLKDFGQDYLRVFQECSKIVAVSTDMYNQLKRLGASEKKLSLQPYGVDLTFFKPSNRVVKEVSSLLFVGRLTPKKSPILLLKAFKLVHQKFPEVILNIVGTGELLNSVQNFIKQDKLENRVKLLGVLGPAEVVTQLQNCDLFVQHSIHADNGDSEGTPNSIIEAAACGKPIVSTLHAGIKEAVINNVTGLLVEERDFQAMAEKIIYLIENPEICQAMGRAGRHHISMHYNLENSINSLRTIIYS